MPSITQRLIEKKYINPPKWLSSSIHYECIMGSQAYGVANADSDVDIYGFCIPPKSIIFPHTSGYIYGFGKPSIVFEQFCTKKGVKIDKGNRPKGLKANSYDITIQSIVKYFYLLMQNNPNMIDSLFVPHRCITHITQIGQLVRENRIIFLHKGCWHRFKGYAYSQMHKMRSQNRVGKRKEIYEKYGYDVKFAYHCIRLLDEVEQILETGNLNLERAKEQMKEIRRGEWNEKKVRDYFSTKGKKLEELYQKSKLPYGPNEENIKRLLFSCLEEQYGKLSEAEIAIPGIEKSALIEIQKIIERIVR